MSYYRWLGEVSWRDARAKAACRRREIIVASSRVELSTVALASMCSSEPIVIVTKPDTSVAIVKAATQPRTLNGITNLQRDLMTLLLWSLASTWSLTDKNVPFRCECRIISVVRIHDLLAMFDRGKAQICRSRWKNVACEQPLLLFQSANEFGPAVGDGVGLRLIRHHQPHQIAQLL